jgi:hypothetical protein
LVRRLATWLPPTQAMVFPERHSKTPVAQMHFASELPLPQDNCSIQNDHPSKFRMNVF